MCPNCGNRIAADKVNVTTDVATCDSCEGVFRANELPIDVDLQGVTPPDGSSIALEARDSLCGTLSIPRLGIRGIQPALAILATVFAAVFVLFLVRWLTGQEDPQTFQILGMISFGLVPLVIWPGLINSAMERQLIDLKLSDISIRKLRPFFPRDYTIPYDTITSVSVQPANEKNPLIVFFRTRAAETAQERGVPLQFPTIGHGDKKTHFGENLSLADMEWCAGLISDVVRKRKANASRFVSDTTSEGHVDVRPQVDETGDRSLVCPNCSKTIEWADVNVASDEAVCRSCDAVLAAADLLTDAELRERWQPPEGSRIRFIEGSESACASIEMPRFRFVGKGLWRKVFQLVFSVVFACFLTWFMLVWTCAALRGGTVVGVFMALAGAVFWLVALGLWWGIYTSLTERQTLVLGASALTITRRRPLFSTSVSLAYADIDEIVIERVMPRDPFTTGRVMASLANVGTAPWTGIPWPAIKHGTRKAYFGEMATDEETGWLVGIMSALVRKRKGMSSAEPEGAQGASATAAADELIHETLRPPVGSRIECARTEESCATVTIPRLGLTRTNYTAFISGAIGALIIGFWSLFVPLLFLAAITSYLEGRAELPELCLVLVFSAILVVMWAFAVPVCRGLWRVLFERQFIELAQDSVKITWQGLLSSKHRTILSAEIQSVEIQEISAQRGFSRRAMLRSLCQRGLCLVVRINSEPLYLAETLTEPEIEWLADVLRSALPDGPGETSEGCLAT